MPLTRQEGEFSQSSNVVTIATPDPVPVDLFLFVGTSNMRSLRSTSPPPANLTGPMAGANIWNTTVGAFQTYAARVNSDTFNSSTSWGPEAEFARQYLIVNPGGSIYMAKIAVNNSLLMFPSASPNWNPLGGDLFDDMTAVVNAAKAALEDDGFAPQVRAVLLDMGWNDAKLAPDAAAFSANLSAFIAAARTEWGDANTVFILNRIQEALTLPFSASVRASQVSVAESTPLVEWFNGDDYPVDTVFGPSPHYVNTGIVAVGYDFFHKYHGDYPALSNTPNPTFANVKLLAGFDGADGATTYTEESSSARVATFAGNAQLDTAAASVVYGTACLLLDGTGDEVTFPDSVDFSLGSGPFMMEFTLRLNALANNSALINQWDAGANQKSFTIDYDNVAHTFRFSYSTNGSTTVTVLTAEFYASVSKYDRFLIERDGANDLRVFQNGIMIGKVNIGGVVFFNSSAVFKIGGLTGFAAFSMNGIMDELRIVKGQATHGSDNRFLPRADKFPRS